MASISRDDVAHVAKLARLELTDDELDRFTGQLGAMLEHAADVAALDVDRRAADRAPAAAANVLRDDEVRPQASTATRCSRSARSRSTACSACRRILGEAP